MSVSLRARRAATLSLLACATAWSSLASAAQPQIVAAGYGGYEGNSGTTVFPIEVNLTAATNVPVTFTLTTSGGTATAGVDYVAKTFTNQVIPAGQTHWESSIVVNGDTTFEPDETFTLVMTQITNATLMGETYCEITNDDAAPANLPTISVADVSITEGDFGNKNATFTAKLTAAAPGPVTFDVSTPGGNTASPGIDHVYTTYDNLQIPTGQTSKTFVVPIIGDTEVESDEKFNVFLADVRGAVAGDTQALGTIVNDDVPPPPSMWINDVTVTEGNGPLTKVATFTVTLSAAQAGPVFFDFATANGTATAGSDYVAKSTPGVRIPAGATSKTVSVTIMGDTVGEPDETFYANISNPVGATIVYYGQGLGTISNDDAVPLPSITINDASDVEGDRYGSIYFTATLSQPSTEYVTVNATTSDGTAFAGEDYQDQVAQTITFYPGQTSQGFLVYVNTDLKEEADETFTVNLSDPVNATIADGQAVGTIVNDDFGLPPTLSISDAHVEEGDNDTREIVFTVSLSEVAKKSVGFGFVTGDGTAISNYDYDWVTGGASLAEGTSSMTIRIGVKGDYLKEGDEYFTVTISDADTAVIGQATAKGWIHDANDTELAPRLTLYGYESTQEGDSWSNYASFFVNLAQPAPADVSFDFNTADGTAKAGLDYVAQSLHVVIPAGQNSAWLQVEVMADTVVEPDETFSASVSNVSGAIVMDGSESYTIVNDDIQRPTISIGDVSVSEGNSGTKTANFTVSLSEPSASTVSFDVVTNNGSAVAGSDYTAVSLFGQQIAPGQTSKTISVAISGDTTVETDETFYISLSGVYNANVGDAAAIGTILNDDSASSPTLSINDVSIAEGNSLTRSATFTITLSQAQAGPVFVDVSTSNGDALAGSDYVAKTTTGLRIPAGSTSKTFAVTVNGDTTSEGDESFYVNLTNPVGATLADIQGRGTITNDDGVATNGLSIGDVSIAEGNSGTKTATFTVSLSAPAAGTVTYDIATANGTATAGSDYVASSLVGQSIAAGQSSKTFSVTINGDTTVEANETFMVNVSNVAGASVADNQAVGTITNDDSGGGGGPTLTIADVAIAEGNALTKTMSFTVKLSAAATGPVTYSIATADGTAVSTSDYTAKSLTGQSIPAGVTSKVFTVVIKGDRQVEPNETFFVNVTGVTGATVGDGQAIGTITNDDAATLTLARIDAKGLVDDIDDGNRQPQVAPSEYALLLAETANRLCRRAPNAGVIAVEGVEHQQVLADLADAANATCTAKPRYAAVMAEGDSRGFLIEVPAKDAVGIAVLGKPEVDAVAKTTTLSILGAGHATPVKLVLADATSKVPNAANEALVVFGAKAANGLVDLTGRELSRAKALPSERVLVSPSLLKAYTKPAIMQPMLPATEAPAQVLQLQ